jgi:competence protein ComEA
MTKYIRFSGIIVFAIIMTLVVSQPSFAVDNKVDINHASIEQLMSLKYVGEIIAKRIIEHREQIQGFKTVEAIKDVNGFGPKAWEANKDRIIITPFKKKGG